MGHHEVVLLCPERAAGARLDRLDVETIDGPVHSTPSLDAARAGRADLFVACATADSQNMLACLAAKRLDAKRTPCFLFRRQRWSRINRQQDVSPLWDVVKFVWEVLPIPMENLAHWWSLTRHSGQPLPTVRPVRRSCTYSPGTHRQPARTRPSWTWYWSARNAPRWGSSGSAILSRPARGGP